MCREGLRVLTARLGCLGTKKARTFVTIDVVRASLAFRCNFETTVLAIAIAAQRLADQRLADHKPGDYPNSHPH